MLGKGWIFFHSRQENFFLEIFPWGKISRKNIKEKSQGKISRKNLKKIFSDFFLKDFQPLFFYVTLFFLSTYLRPYFSQWKNFPWDFSQGKVFSRKKKIQTRNPRFFQKKSVWDFSDFGFGFFFSGKKFSLRKISRKNFSCQLW